MSNSQSVREERALFNTANLERYLNGKNEFKEKAAVMFKPPHVFHPLIRRCVKVSPKDISSDLIAHIGTLGGKKRINPKTHYRCMKSSTSFQQPDG